MSKILVALLAVGIGCGGDRDTLLQLDVQPPAGVSVHQITVLIANETRTYTGELPQDGGALGVDMYLPRAVTGTQIVLVQAVDSRRCVIAEENVTVTLTPGQRIHGGLVSLKILHSALCEDDQDAGAATDSDPGPGDGGADDIDAPPTGPLDSDGDAAGIGMADVSDGPSGDGRDGRADASSVSDASRETAPVPDAPPPPRRCTSAAACAAGENCLSGICQSASPDCADIARRDPAAPDGVYALRAGAAYCDMRLKSVLCASVSAAHTGRTRDGADLPFAFSSVLESGDVCRIWAVRHQTGGQPFASLKNLATIADAKVKSTCEALGFKADEDIQDQCYYGSLAHCGFAVKVVSGPNGRYVSKWGNSADTNPNRGRGFYSFEDRIQVSRIPWTFDGAMFGRCRVR